MCFHRRPDHPAPILGSLAACLLAGCTAGDPAAPGPAATAAGLGRVPAGLTLIGLGGGDLEGVMGEPALVRAEGSAQYWRYGIAGCQLDLFLFADQAAGPPRVAYLDVRPARGTPPTVAADCSLLAARLRTGTPPAPAAKPRQPSVTEPL